MRFQGESRRHVRQRERLRSTLRVRPFGWLVVRSLRPRHGSALTFGVPYALRRSDLRPTSSSLPGAFCSEVAACRSAMGLDAPSASSGAKTAIRGVFHVKNFAEYLIPLILDNCRLIEGNGYCGNRTIVPIATHAATDDVDAPVDEIG